MVIPEIDPVYYNPCNGYETFVVRKMVMTGNTSR